MAINHLKLPVLANYASLAPAFRGLLAFQLLALGVQNKRVNLEFIPFVVSLEKGDHMSLPAAVVK